MPAYDLLQSLMVAACAQQYEEGMCLAAKEWSNTDVEAYLSFSAKHWKSIKDSWHDKLQALPARQPSYIRQPACGHGY